MRCSRLLTLTAIIEAATGLALMAAPSLAVRLLLGSEISGASLPLGRVAGFGLLSLGLACWPGRNPTGNTAHALRALILKLTDGDIHKLRLMRAR
jgi:hypothetical protein